MDEALDALLQLDEGAVIGDAEHAPFNPRADGIALGGIEPRIGRELLEAERDALLVFVELENLDLDLIADVDQIARMRESAPGHIGDVQQAVDPTQVDESAVVGEVLHGARQDHALFEVLQGLRAADRLLFLEDLFARDDDVAALLVQLDNADLNGLTDPGVEIAHRAQLQLRAGQERLNADVDREATLHATHHRAGDRRLFVVRLLHRVPHAQPLGFFVAKQVAAFRLLALDHDVDTVARLQLRLAGVVDNLFDGNETFGLHADVDNHMLVRQLDDRAGDDRAVVEGLRRGFGSLLAVEGLQRSGEVFHAQVRLFVLLRSLGSQFRLRGFGRDLRPGFAGLGVGGGFSRRFRLLRRSFQRWRFHFGVQRVALGRFRIEDVCHRQFRDSCGGSRNSPRSDGIQQEQRAGFPGCSFLRRQREGVGPWRGSRRSSGIVPAVESVSTRSYPSETVRVGIAHRSPD